MCLLLETIKVAGRQFHNLSFHAARMNTARHDLHGCEDVLDLEKFLQVPARLDESRYKCRIEYTDTVRKIDFIGYVPKVVRSLKLVVSDPFDYRYKYADRTALEALRAMKGLCDDIIIVINNRITDSSYSNLAFFNGVEWHTPLKPLLRGTKLRQLLAEGILQEKDIQISNLNGYQKVSLINAMLELGEIEVEIDSIC